MGLSILRPNLVSMNTPLNPPLHLQSLSLDHATFFQTLSTTENLLIIQDLDGVCMALVNDPLDRTIRPEYVGATRAFDGHFYVLTNGEHIGRRGLNRIIDQSFDATTTQKYEGRYLPGLAAGGVQWQDRSGAVSHPGVSEAELSFLEQVPQHMAACIGNFLLKSALPGDVDRAVDRYVQKAVLDNVASPTANLNSIYPVLAEEPGLFVALQTQLRSLMDQLLAEATRRGLGNSFFVHYAPNLGRDSSGKEIVWFAEQGQSGTTDFQFMLRGAVKEAGVLMLLNKYYGDRTGSHPLGRDFNAREAPQSLEALIKLAADNFDPALMPLIVGVGDTVTSQVTNTLDGGEGSVKRGGSDRNFLQLIQILGQAFDSSNLTVYIDSSGGQLKNRQPLQLTGEGTDRRVVAGPGDRADPLVLNVAFPGGPEEYCQLFEQAAQKRSQRGG